MAGRLAYDIDLAPASPGPYTSPARSHEPTATSSRPRPPTTCHGVRPCRAAPTGASTAGSSSRRPVDSATSSIGHLLGTALLNHEESTLPATRLTAPDLNCGHALRTLSSESGGNPYGYRTGPIWPHDTAIAVHGWSGPASSVLQAALGLDADVPGGTLTVAPTSRTRTAR